MSLPPLQTRHYRVELLTEQYFLTAVLEPFGSLMNYLNHSERKTVPLKNVRATALDAASVVNAFQAEALWTRREEILAIRVLDPVSPETLRLLPVKEHLRVFLPRFAVQATFSRGPDTQLGDIFEGVSGVWLPATEARVYALVPTKVPVFREAQLLLIHKSGVQFYQPAQG